MLGAAFFACDDGAGPDDGVVIAVQSGAGVSDTIGAGGFELAVRVTQGGEPLAGEPVVFASVGITRLDLGQGAVKPERPVETTTDATGVARVFVWFADQAGPGVVRVTLPERQASIDVSYTVRAGTPVGVAILPQDTALEVGAAFDLRASAVDRGGNPTAGAVFLQSLTPAVATITAGRTVHGAGTGRALIVARFGESADTGFISVVPEHKLVAVAAVSGGSDALLVFDLDGGARMVLELLPTTSDGVAHPDWHPVNGRVAYEVPHGAGRALQAVDFNAGRGPLIDPATFAVATWPQFSADGEWLFLAGRDADDQPIRIWRAAHDGGAPIPISAAGAGDAAAPSPAPGAERVAFAADDSIRVLHVATGSVAAITVGSMPRWSPDGTRIAFHDDGAIWLIRPDGGGRVRLTSESSSWHAESLDWSPDSDWLAAHSIDDGVLVVIEVATGVALPLAYTRGWTQPAFAPPQIGP